MQTNKTHKDNFFRKNIPIKDQRVECKKERIRKDAINICNVHKASIVDQI